MLCAFTHEIVAIAFPVNTSFISTKDSSFACRVCRIIPKTSVRPISEQKLSILRCCTSHLTFEMYHRLLPSFKSKHSRVLLAFHHLRLHFPFTTHSPDEGRGDFKPSQNPSHALSHSAFERLLQQSTTPSYTGLTKSSRFTRKSRHLRPCRRRCCICRLDRIAWIVHVAFQYTLEVLSRRHANIVKIQERLSYPLRGLHRQPHELLPDGFVLVQAQRDKLVRVPLALRFLLPFQPGTMMRHVRKGLGQIQEIRNVHPESLPPGLVRVAQLR